MTVVPDAHAVSGGRALRSQPPTPGAPRRTRPAGRCEPPSVFGRRSKHISQRLAGTLETAHGSPRGHTLPRPAGTGHDVRGQKGGRWRRTERQPAARTARFVSPTPPPAKGRSPCGPCLHLPAPHPAGPGARGTETGWMAVTARPSSRKTHEELELLTRCRLLRGQTYCTL